MGFQEQDIEKLAHLARIELTGEEKKKFAEQISSILDYVKQIQEVDTSEVKDISHLKDLINIWREDEVKECQNVNEIIDQFPEKHGNFNKVKPVLE
ncbi:Asp-tRNA(Asn)/Glu-tRNA(Gln) amidotransferase subunit GatC [Patescibacteria group bacterium]|nr:Asp-tRNA(Asn)/Glu-tRNA(Gln) amidotransferase subunit GatC [Patescibacteria group bacterium]MBU0964486.1 Asp-tRNA(Asn)/Glu-tRNA(Gln) amidotransferase subunit GatC [Patescibacteria group bacterium]